MLGALNFKGGGTDNFFGWRFGGDFGAAEGFCALLVGRGGRWAFEGEAILTYFLDRSRENSGMGLLKRNSFVEDVLVSSEQILAYVSTSHKS